MLEKKYIGIAALYFGLDANICIFNKNYKSNYFQENIMDKSINYS